MNFLPSFAPRWRSSLRRWRNRPQRPQGSSPHPRLGWKVGENAGCSRVKWLGLSEPLLYCCRCNFFALVAIWRVLQWEGGRIFVSPIIDAIVILVCVPKQHLLVAHSLRPKWKLASTKDVLSVQINHLVSCPEWLWVKPQVFVWCWQVYHLVSFRF